MTTKACVSVRSQTEIGFCGTMFSPQRGSFTTVTHAVCPLMEGHCVTALPPEQIDCGRVCWGLSITVWSRQAKPVLGSGCWFSWEAQALGWSLKNNLLSPPDYKWKWKRKNTTSLKYIKYISKECPKSLLMCWKVFILTMLGLRGILKGHSLVWGAGLIGGIILRRET